jgi:Peptidase family M23
MLRRLVVAACALALSVPFAADAAATAEPAWVKPVPGALVRSFIQPVAQWAPGHLGVDFAAAPGTPVRAAGAGEVSFAGTVAGALHVVVAHPGGLRTSYAFVASIAVRRGQTVQRGEVIATAGGTGTNHDATVLHLGLRHGDTYIDPMTLFRTVDLAEVVQLAPTQEPFGYSVAQERRGILDGLRGAAGALSGAGFDLVRGAADAASTTFTALEPLIRTLGSRFSERALRLWEGFPPTGWGDVLVLAAEVAVAMANEYEDCTWSAPPADGTGGSGHHVMVVGGVGSSTRADGSTTDIPLHQLGYKPDEIAYYSYAPDGGAYTAIDTLGPIYGAALRLAEQLKEQQRRAPYREVDLIAHSLGGTVVLAFMRLVYDPGDPAYPPIGKVVTLAAPLEGVPLATFVDFLREVPGLDREIPAEGAIADLSETSDLMRRLRAVETPGSIELTTIGSMFDVLVPADLATTDGARHTVVETDTTEPWTAHLAVLEDGFSLAAVRAAIESRQLPCPNPTTVILGELLPPMVTGFESGLTPFPWGAPFDGP